MRQLLRVFDRHMVRPWLYTAFTRFIFALTGALLLDFLVKTSDLINFRMYAFLFLGVFFALLAWIAYLRLDGVRLPKAMMKRVGPRKKTVRSYGDMIDYVDEHPPVTFDDLEDDEKDICCLGADIVCCVVFVVLSFVV